MFVPWRGVTYCKILLPNVEHNTASVRGIILQQQHVLVLNWHFQIKECEMSRAHMDMDTASYRRVIPVTPCDHGSTHVTKRDSPRSGSMLSSCNRKWFSF